MFGSIVETLHWGEKVELRGVPSRRVTYFTPGKELKELLNRGPAQQVAPPSE